MKRPRSFYKNIGETTEHVSTRFLVMMEHDFVTFGYVYFVHCAFVLNIFSLQVHLETSTNIYGDLMQKSFAKIP